MHAIGVGFFVGAGIPKGARANTFAECGCCGAYHRTDFNGDCREDSERHWDLPDDAVVVYLDKEHDDDDPPHSNNCPRAVLSSAECLCPAQDASRYRDEDYEQ